MTQAQLLADMFEKARALNFFYISKLKEVDPITTIELGEIKFNSLYWLTAHLLWAEDNLIMKMTGADSVAPSWATHYCLGSDGSLHIGHGSFKELLNELKAMHQKCMEHLRQLTDEDLASENTHKFHLGDGDCSKRFSIQHAIRHESTHTGQYGWIAKMLSIATV